MALDDPEADLDNFFAECEEMGQGLPGERLGSGAASSSGAGPRGATSTSKVIEEAKEPASLRDQGVLSPEEFQSAKTALLQKP